MLPLLRSPAPEFTAVAQAQLETIHYMAHVYLKQRDRYPQTLQELRQSPYWVVEVTNSCTGLPIQQIPFTPHAEDYLTDPLLEGSLAPPPAGDASNENVAQGPTAPIVPGLSSVSGRRIEPRRVEFPTPGDILYFTDGDSLQLVIYDDAGAWQELWVAHPYNYLAASLRITEKERPQSDFVVAELATHLERMLPGMYNRLLFLTDENTYAPSELTAMLPQQFEKMAQRLGLIYVNPVKRRAFMRADYYSAGDLSIAEWLEEEGLFYFLEGKRARTLSELTDQRVLREHAREISRRDKLLAKHADDVLDQSS